MVGGSSELNLQKVQDLQYMLQSSGNSFPRSVFVYYCDVCGELLVISQVLIDVENVSFVFRWRCPCCHLSLDLGLKCRRIWATQTIRPQIHTKCADESLLLRNHRQTVNGSPTLIPFLKPDIKYLQRSMPSNLQTVDVKPKSVMRNLSFNIAPLDNLLGGLELGQLTVFYGSWLCHTLSELLCVRAQLPSKHGGLDSTAIFIDGGNIFDPYLISEYAQHYGLEPDQALEKVRVSRAFTYHQLTSLITDRLQRALEKYGSKLVVISNIIQLFCDPDAEVVEAKDMFNHVTSLLSKLAEEQRIIILATHIAGSTQGGSGLPESFLFSRAHVLVNIKEETHTSFVLEKHPYLPPNLAEMDSCQPSKPALEEFLKVRLHG